MRRTVNVLEKGEGGTGRADGKAERERKTRRKRMRLLVEERE